MKALLTAVLLALTPLAKAASFGASCAPDQISILCPQTITEASSPTWTGGHYWNGVGTQFLVDNNGRGQMEVRGSTIIGRGPTGGAEAGGIFVGLGFRGTIAAPTAVLSGDPLGIAGFSGHDGVGYQQTRARMLGFAGENWSATNQGAGLRFDTTPNGSTTRQTRLLLNPGGGVGVGFPQGTSLPQNFNVANNSFFNGFVGISTAIPQAPLHIGATIQTGFYHYLDLPPSGVLIANSTGVVVRSTRVATGDGWTSFNYNGVFSYAYNGVPAFTGHCASGSEAAPGACPDASFITFIGAKPYDGVTATTLQPSAGAIGIISSGTASGTNRGTMIRLETTANGSTTRRIRMLIGGEGITTIAPRANAVASPQGQLHVRANDPGIGITGRPVSIHAEEAIVAVGSVTTPTLVATNVNSTNVTAANVIQGSSLIGTNSMSAPDITATGVGFTGSGYNIYATAVAASSMPAAAVSIATTSYVPLAVTTTTLRGGANRRVLLIYNANLDNGSAGQRNYTLSAKANGTGVGLAHRQTILAGDAENITFFQYLSTTTFSAGVSTFTIQGFSNNATGTQTLNQAAFTVVEF